MTVNSILKMATLAQNSDQLNNDFAKVVLPVTVFVGILACVGFLGNVLVLYVFSFKYHKCNYKYFVLFLALIDLTSCLTTMPGEIVTQSFWYTYRVPVICKVKSFFNVSTVCASAFCLLLIAIDRYRKVCKPSSWQIRPKVAIFLCICALVIASIVAIPVTIYWGVQSYNVTSVNVTSCETDANFKNTEYPLIYSSMTSAIIALPMTVMAALYFLIYHEIRRGRHRARTTDTIDEGLHLLVQSSAEAHPQIERKTLIMFIFSAVFFITTVIYLILLSLIASEDEILRKLTVGELVVYFFFFRLYFIHHAINPFVYAFLDVHFQEALREMICRKRN